MIGRVSRRSFVKTMGALFSAFAINIDIEALALTNERKSSSESMEKRLGLNADGDSEIFLVRNGSPEENMKKLLQMMGGIESIIDKDDIVVLKPNAQWWNQGMTNTDSMKEFIQQVLDMPDFKGEVIIAENHQFQDDASRGWTTDTPNGKYNLNQLIDYFQKSGFKNVTKYHWHNGGPNKGLVQGDAHGNNIVKGPDEGDGYVWRNDLIYEAANGRRTMMTYPVFTSEYSGITIDLKNGAWRDGKYLDRKVKLINFPALNYHSSWAGVTCSIKNYLGIVDMSCGYHGETPKGFYNFHYVGNNESKLHPYLEKIREMVGFGYFEHFHGGPVGCFIKNIRMADLNIVTADWIGYGSRTDVNLSARPKTLLASKDPVALDYYAAKYILLPHTPPNIQNGIGDILTQVNDPDNRDGHLRWYLTECHEEGIGNLDESKMKVYQSDLSS